MNLDRAKQLIHGEPDHDFPIESLIHVLEAEVEALLW